MQKSEPSPQSFIYPTGVWRIGCSPSLPSSLVRLPHGYVEDWVTKNAKFDRYRCLCSKCVWRIGESAMIAALLPLSAPHMRGRLAIAHLLTLASKSKRRYYFLSERLSNVRP